MDWKPDDPIVGIGKNAMVAGDVRIHNTHVHAESTHKCASCGRIAREGMFECPDCHRTVCETHYRLKPRLCERCSDRRFRETSEALHGKAGNLPNDLQSLLREIQKSAEYFHPTPESLETQLQKIKHRQPDRDRSGISDRLKLAEARWSAGRREDAINQIEQICRTFGPDDETMNLFTRFKGTLDPVGALAFIRSTDWTTPGRFLAEYSLEDRAESIDMLLERGSFLFPDAPEVILMQAVDELLNALDLRESARLEKARGHLQKLSADLFTPTRRMLESIVDWVKDTSQTPPHFDPANLLTHKLQKAINQVRRSGIKSLRPPSLSFFGGTSQNIPAEDQAINDGQPQNTQRPEDLSVSAFISPEIMTASEVASGDGDLPPSNYSVQESEPIARFQLPPEIHTPPPSSNQTEPIIRGENSLPEAQNTPRRAHWSRNLVMASGLSGIVLVGVLCWANRNTMINSALQKEITRKSDPTNQKRDTNSEDKPRLESGDRNTPVLLRADSSVGQEPNSTEDSVRDAQNIDSKANDSRDSSNTTSITETNNVTAGATDNKETVSTVKTDNSTSETPTKAILSTAPEKDTNVESKSQVEPDGNTTQP